MFWLFGAFAKEQRHTRQAETQKSSRGGITWKRAINQGMERLIINCKHLIWYRRQIADKVYWIWKLLKSLLKSLLKIVLKSLLKNIFITFILPILTFLHAKIDQVQMNNNPSIYLNFQLCSNKLVFAVFLTQTLRFFRHFYDDFRRLFTQERHHQCSVRVT